MKNIFILAICFAVQCCGLSAMPRDRFVMQQGMAQYKGSDYSNVVQVARHISLDEAFEIAENNPDIDYFFYTTGYTMVLEIPPEVPFDRSQDRFGLVTYTDFIYDYGDLSRGFCRIFRHGDTVFFKKEGMWLGTSPGLADTYVKR
jgi:hypothetical protein